MKSSVVAITALPKSLSLVNRDNHLNERAYQRALAQKNSQRHQDSTLYSALEFQSSDELSLQQMVKEKASRKRVLEMQHQLNELCPQNADLVMH